MELNQRLARRAHEDAIRLRFYHEFVGALQFVKVVGVFDQDGRDRRVVAGVFGEE